MLIVTGANGFLGAMANGLFKPPTIFTNWMDVSAQAADDKQKEAKRRRMILEKDIVAFIVF